MTTDTYAPSAVGERIRELCREFKLPTLAAETVGRFSEAGHADALPTLMEVLEQEAEDRRIRRVDRLRRASRLPAGKTWDTFEHDRAPVKLRQRLERLAEGDRFSDAGHADALPTLMEVLEQEAEDRRIRRVDRLRRAQAARRQDLGYFRARAGAREAQGQLGQACRSIPAWTGASTCLRSVCRAPARRTLCAP